MRYRLLFFVALCVTCVKANQNRRHYPPGDYDRAVAAYFMKVQADAAYLKGATCTSAPNGDLLKFCERRCGEISSRELRGMCTGNCRLIDLAQNPDLYRFCEISAGQYKSYGCGRINDAFIRERCEKLNAYREEDPTPATDVGSEPSGPDDSGESCIADGNKSDDARGDSCCSGNTRIVNKPEYPEFYCCTPPDC